MSYKSLLVATLFVGSASFGFDIEKFIDKNATETESYKDFIKKHGTSSYHTCKMG